MIGLSRAAGGRAVKAGVAANVVPALVEGGRWALSRIVSDGPNAFTTAAMLQVLAPRIVAHYPPMNATKTGYVGTHALVQLLGAVGAPTVDTELLPPLAFTAPLGAQAAAVRTLLESLFSRYRYLDWTKATVGKALIPVAAYSSTTSFAQVLADVLQHLEHSTWRPKPNAVEPHNTEYLDDFSTDPAGRWTATSSSATWDSTDNEYDVSMTANPGLRYSANDPGSIDQEAQVTNIANTTLRAAGAAVRFASGGAFDCYCVYENGDGNINIAKFVAGVRTVLTTAAQTYTGGDWRTSRLAAEGAIGANVALDAWYTTHGSTKPADPGWYGTVGSPNLEATDSAADRLDEATHIQCGIAGRSTTDFDTRHDFWKSRAISDRSGAAPTDMKWAGPTTVPVRRPRGVAPYGSGAPRAEAA